MSPWRTLLGGYPATRALLEGRVNYNQRRLDVDYVLREERPGTWWPARPGAALLAAIAFIVQQKGTL